MERFFCYITEKFPCDEGIEKLQTMDTVLSSSEIFSSIVDFLVNNLLGRLGFHLKAFEERENGIKKDTPFHYNITFFSSVFVSTLFPFFIPGSEPALAESLKNYGGTDKVQ